MFGHWVVVFPSPPTYKDHICVTATLIPLVITIDNAYMRLRRHGDANSVWLYISQRGTHQTL